MYLPQFQKEHRETMAVLTFVQLQEEEGCHNIDLEGTGSGRISLPHQVMTEALGEIPRGRRASQGAHHVRWSPPKQEVCTTGQAESPTCLLPQKPFIEALDGSWCHMSILRNDNVACLCHLIFPLSPVEFKKWPCPMSLSFGAPCRCH